MNMKELYFTPNSIDEQAQQFLHAATRFRKRDLGRFSPGRSALLVLDMQRYFLEPSSHAYIPSASAIIPRINQLVHAYSDHGFPYFYSRHLNSPQDALMMAKWWRDLIGKGELMGEVSPEIDLLDGIPVEKTQYDAFYKTNLEEMLKKLSVEQLLITGVMTHLCCETTARAAFVRGFEVLFVVDATATYNQQLHLASLTTLSHGFVTPILASEIIQILGL